MSQIIIPLQVCQKCGKKNVPRINGDGTITPRVTCLGRNCRNILDPERKRKSKERQLANLLYLDKAKIQKIINKEQKKKREIFFCIKCEMEFQSSLNLERHNLRRHP